jgi:hypothetical protein
MALGYHAYPTAMLSLQGCRADCGNHAGEGSLEVHRKTKCEHGPLVLLEIIQYSLIARG